MSAPPFPAEPWAVREPELDLDRLAHTETIFALSNGHIGLRGNLDEGEPHGMPGSYLNSFYELHPLPYAEAGYGYPESGQTIINVTNGKLIRLLVDDEPFDLRYGSLRSHERVLDLRAGTLSRSVEWCSPAGQVARVRSERLVSLTQRAVAAIHYEVEAVGDEMRVVVQSELFANEQLPVGGRGDPRVAAVLAHPLVAELHQVDPAGATLVHRTKGSGLRMGAAMDHEVHGPERTEMHSTATDDVGRTTVICRLAPGERLRIVKYLAYGWSSQRSLPAIFDQVRAALAAARFTGWAGLAAEHRAYLDEFWAGADVEIAGDERLQQALRFALFHVLQAGARAECRAIPAKGLTGPGYDGHTFWDTETFVLPVLTHTVPAAAVDALCWRAAILPEARARAAQLGLRGAAFPWRTIRGHECSGYWPAGTAAFHVNADIADAVLRHVDATGDEEFERAPGCELLVETARLWRSLGHHDAAGGFRIDGITGPDEYTAIVDNNVYTNLMAQRNLAAAADVAERHPSRAAELGVTGGEIAAWRDAAAAMIVPYDEKLGVHPAAEGFTDHAVWDFAATPAEHYPLLLHYPYFDLYRKQVVKQADLVLAMQQRPEMFTAEQQAANFGYYERITVRDSSLSATSQAVLAARTGHLELALDYLAEAALLDLADGAGNTASGMHIAATAGTWTAIVVGFGGLRETGAQLAFAPQLTSSLGRVTFRLRWRGRLLRVAMEPTAAEYRLLDGPPLRLRHHGEELTLTPDEPMERRSVTPPPPLRQPVQPPGREPRRWEPGRQPGPGRQPHTARET